ncbi:MAG: hypothetical protein KF889_26345 [Alphaproteobacteria bacterium]|nr:hypothetical protein [Alphaproteobacteria bacterium]MCW5739483.1 hypothetical protein [Alphaproteobacteria bacterium]
MHVLALIAALLFALGAALRMGTDLSAIFLRYAAMTPLSEPPWLAQTVASLLVAGALVGLPLQIRIAADRSDQARPKLFAGAGALVSVVIIILSLVVIGLHGDLPMLQMIVLRQGLDMGGQLGAMPVLLMLSGMAAIAGRLAPSAGALLAAPLIMLGAMALTLEVSIVGAALTAMLFLLLCAAALLPAAILGRRPALAVWPIAAVSVSAFGLILHPGLLTPGELTALLATAAIVVGATGLVGASPERRRAWLERAAGELGAIVLALAALNLMSFLITAVPWIVDGKRALAGVTPAMMLAGTFIAYIVVAAFTGPLTGVAVVLIMISATYGAGVPADILVVGLAIAALQNMVGRGTARQSPQGEAVALPARQAGWTQTLIIFIVMALGAAIVLGWI